MTVLTQFWPAMVAAFLAVRDVFKALYDQGHERWDHSAFLLYLEKLNAPARLSNKANTPPE